MARCIKPDALKDMDFDNPQPVGDYKFVQDRITNVKEEIEGATSQKYSTFEAIEFIKRDCTFIVRVDCGGDRYIDVKLNDKLLQNFETNRKQLDDPMRF